MSEALRRSAANVEIVQKSATVALRISREQGALEREVAQTKWFDYRFLSPLDATGLFAQKYHEVFRWKWGIYFATIEGPKKQAIRKGNWQSSRREFTSFWNARQFADLLGVPYEFFCEHAIEVLMRKGWTTIPRPNQLYPSSAISRIIERVQQAWQEHCSDVTFMMSDLPQYHLSNFIGEPAQSLHQDWIVDQIRLRHGRPRTIAAACIQAGVLPIHRAHFEFGPSRVKQAQEEDEIFGGTRTAAVPVDKHDLRPSCFGILHAYDAEIPICAACAFHDDCKKITAKMAQIVTARCGADDPALARKRKLGRERVRLHRERKKTVPPAPTRASI